MKHYIIFCAGREKSEEYSDGYEFQDWNKSTNPYRNKPKQFLEVDGESLINRTIRLLNVFDKNSKIYIVAKTEEFILPNSEIFLVPKKDITPWLYDRVLQVQEIFSKDDSTVFLYGDVWYSEDAIKKITSYSGKFQWFGRLKPSNITKKNRGEDFAFYISNEEIPNFIYKLNLAKKKRLESEHPIIYWWDVHFMFVYFEMNNMCYDYNTFLPTEDNCPNWTIIDDFTDDFDYPEEFTKWRSLYEQR